MLTCGLQLNKAGAIQCRRPKLTQMRLGSRYRCGAPATPLQQVCYATDCGQQLPTICKVSIIRTAIYAHDPAANEHRLGHPVQMPTVSSDEVRTHCRCGSLPTSYTGCLCGLKTPALSAHIDHTQVAGQVLCCGLASATWKSIALRL